MRLFRIIAVGLALAACAPATLTATEPGTGRAVLLVHGEDPYLPWVSEVTAGIYGVLEADPAGRPDIYVEHLDLARFPEPVQIRAHAAWLMEKYRQQRMDAILVVTKGGLDFIAPLARELWPGVPIVLIENERLVRDVPLPERVFPVLARFEIAETIDLAKALFPGTRSVAFVNGAPDVEVAETEYFRKDFRARGDGLELIDLTGLPMAGLQERIGRLPEDTVVFYWGIRVDGAGRSFIPREALRLFAPHSNRPIFSTHATMIGYGLVGGHLLSYVELGREGGRAVQRILAGEPASSIAPIRQSFSHPVFDDRELRRFDIPADRLPAGSDVRFRKETLWTRYPHLVAGAVAALVLQTALITTLLLERRRRGLAQALTGATLASLPGQVAVLDGGGRVVQVNENWEAFAAAGERSPAGGVPVGEDYLEAWRRARASVGPLAEAGLRQVQDVLQGSAKHGTLEYSLPEGGRDRWFEMHVEELRPPGRGAVVVQVDVTQRRQAATEVRMRDREIAHLNRVGAIGELASSLAHELGQPLGAILANAQAARRLLSRPSPDLEEVRASLSDIIEDDQRAGHVIQRVRALLRAEETPRDTVDVNEVVRSVLRMVAGEASLRGASIQPVLASSSPAVFGDRVQLGQVFLNLVLNGLDAVAERTPGQREVRVSTSVVERKCGGVGQRYGPRNSEPGPRARLRTLFHDEGARARHGAFDLPFDRRGARRGDPGGERRGRRRSVPLRISGGGESSGVSPPGAVVFVVDDDPSMLRALARLLKASGRDVEAFASPREFLARPAHDGPGCLVLDLKMPGLSGLEVQEALLSSARDLPIVFISGHGKVPAAVRAMKAGAIDFLTKPFPDDVLLASVDTAIAQSVSSLADRSDRQAIEARLRSLTPREREVLPLVARGPAQQADRRAPRDVAADHQGPSGARDGKDAGGLARRSGAHGRTGRHRALARQHALDCAGLR